MKDRDFCCVSACMNGVSCRKLPYAMYMLQCAGMDLAYKFTVKNSRLKSHGLQAVINNIQALGYITKKYELTDEGSYFLSHYFLTVAEDESIDNVCKLCVSMSADDLYLICVTDILIQEILDAEGVDALVKEKESIRGMVKGLCDAYSDEAFDDAVGIMRIIRKGDWDEWY